MATGPKFLALILSLVVSCPLAGAAAPSSSPAISARVAETHGTVFKRGFVDWEKEEWADPEPARQGDNLDEGMQVGTGDKSWAEVTWPTVTTRAWANSVFAVAPNQRLVYLLGGQMLFNLDKHRKDKKDFFVWTKVLQARIRGTTVMVQATHDVSRITVLEGVVEVMNRLDKSVVRVAPGVVYEIRTPGTTPLPPNVSQGQTTTSTPNIASTTEDIVETTDETVNDQMPLKLMDKPLTKLSDISQNMKDAVFHEGSEAIQNASYDGGVKVKPKLVLADLTNMTQPGEAPIMVFADPKAETRLYPANTRGLLAHPLVQGFSIRLPSLALVQNSLSTLAIFEHPLQNANLNHYNRSPEVTLPDISFTGDTISGTVANISATATQTSSIITQNAAILRVPTEQYLVGPGVGYALPLPAQAFNGYLPTGVLTNPTEGLTEGLNSTMTSNGLRGQNMAPPLTNIVTNTQQPGPMPQTGTFVPPTTIPQMTNFIPPTAPLPSVTNFVPPTSSVPTVTNFVPPTAPLPTVTNFVPPTAPLPTVTTFVPPTAPLPTVTTFVPPTAPLQTITNFVPPTATMPMVNTFIPPTTTMPVVNSFVPPPTTQTYSSGGASINLPPATSPSGNFSINIQSGITLPK